MIYKVVIIHMLQNSNFFLVASLQSNIKFLGSLIRDHVMKP
jgi:hypothetical protein